MKNLLGNIRHEAISRYNFLVPHNDGQLLYNQITGGLLWLDKQQAEEYASVSRGNFFISLGLLRCLRKNGFLIKRSFDEREWMKSVFQKVNKEMSAKKNLTIAPTDDCNLNCPYCFESKSQRKYMSQGIQEQTIRFAEKLIGHTETKVLHVTWFGGEPLLHLDAVVYLSRNLQDICRLVGAEFRQTLVTNGTLMTPETSQRLLEVGCRNLQITVDGSREHHDLKRPFLKILDSSYDRIMEQIPRLWQEGFVITLRTDVDDTNFDDFMPHRKQIEELGLTKQSPTGGMVTPYPALIFGNNPLGRAKFSNLEIDNRFLSPATTSSTATLAPFAGTCCLSAQRWSFCVSQNGKLTKCWHHITDERNVIGTVYDVGLAETGWSDDWCPVDDPDCQECPVLPSCFGGCRQQNEYWEKGYQGRKEFGCGSQRWFLERHVKLLYERATKT
jgi:uncharacterized protein